MDSQWATIAEQPGTLLGERAKPHNMCYIIFTSGSTGRPKGAVLQHAGVINYLHCLTECALLIHCCRTASHTMYSAVVTTMPCRSTKGLCGCRKLELGPSDVFLQKAPVSFDASVQELFNSLACGGVLLLAAPGGEKDTQYLARLCKEQRVTCASFVPSQLDVLLQAWCPRPGPNAAQHFNAVTGSPCTQQ